MSSPLLQQTPEAATSDTASLARDVAMRKLFASGMSDIEQLTFIHACLPPNTLQQRLFELLILRRGSSKVTGKDIREIVYAPEKRSDLDSENIHSVPKTLSATLGKLKQAEWLPSVIDIRYEGPALERVYWLELIPRPSEDFAESLASTAPHDFTSLFSWRKKDSAEPVHTDTFLISPTRYNLEVMVSPRGSWRPPEDFPHYDTFAKNVWSQENESHNSKLWHVCNYGPYGSFLTTDRGLNLDVKHVTYRDWLATNHGPTRRVGKKTVREIFNEAPERVCQRFPAYANPLGIVYLAVTRDPYNVLLILEEHEAGRQKLQGIYGFVESVLDGHRTATHIPYPNETAFRKAYEQAGLPIRPQMVRWMGLVFLKESGAPWLLGESQVPFTLQEVKDHFENRPRQSQRQPPSRRFPRRTLEPIALDAGALETWVRDHPNVEIAPTVRAALGLLLWRRRNDQVELSAPTIPPP